MSHLTYSEEAIKRCTCLFGLKSGIVRVALPEKTSVNHNSAIDVYPNEVCLMLKESIPSILTMMRSQHRHKFFSARYELLLHVLLVWMIFERESFERVNSSRSTKLLDAEFFGGFTKDSTVKVEIATLQLKIFHSLTRLLLLAEVIFDTSRLATSRAGCIDMRVWFKQGPKKIICDLFICQECVKTLRGGLVMVLDGFNQQFEVLQRVRIVEVMVSRIGLIRFQFRKVSKQ